MMNYPTIEHISECFIKPKHQVKGSQHPYYLSPWDLVFLAGHYNQKGLFFHKPNTSSFSIHNLLESLKDSLSLTLVHFYPLAGQFDTTVDEDRHRCTVFVDCQKGPGVRFLHATLNATVSDILSPTHVPPVVKSFFDFSNGEVNYDGHTKPLLSIQVTELVDGIFIGCSMNHVVVDGTSFWHFWNVWSQIHRGMGESNLGTNSSLSLIAKPPIHKRWIPEGYGTDDVYLPYTHPDEFIFGFEPPENLRYRFFHFSPETIANLKAECNKEAANYNDNQVAKISSFQALLALVWRSMVRAKGLARDKATHCKLAADNRSRVDPPLPKEYFGNSIGLICTSTTTVGELLEKSLGWVALLLNQAVMSHTEKSVSGFFDSWFESPYVFQMGQVFDEGSIQVGSSPRFDLYDGNEFGELGKPVAVRSGYSNKFDGKVMAFPGRQGGGSVDLEICLLPEFMSALESDEEFMAAVS